MGFKVPGALSKEERSSVPKARPTDRLDLSATYGHTGRDLEQGAAYGQDWAVTSGAIEFGAIRNRCSARSIRLPSKQHPSDCVACYARELRILSVMPFAAATL